LQDGSTPFPADGLRRKRFKTLWSGSVAQSVVVVFFPEVGLYRPATRMRPLHRRRRAWPFGQSIASVKTKLPIH